MKYILLILLLTSCNIAKVLTDGKTEVDDDFFNLEGKINTDYIFFSCESGNPCFLKTIDNEVVNMDTSLTSAKGYFYFDGHIFFQAYDGVDTELYSYNLKTAEVNKYDLRTGGDSNPRSFQQFQGGLYFLAEADGVTGGGLCKLTNAGATADCRGSYPIASAHYLVTGHYNNFQDSKLFVCHNNGSNKIHEVDTADVNFLKTIVVTTGYATSMACTSGNASRGYTANGFLFEAMTVNLLRYDISTGSFSGDPSPGAGAGGILASHEGVFYYESGPSTLSFVDTTSNLAAPSHITNIPSGYNPSNKLLVDGGDNIFFTDNDASGFDQIFQVNKSDLTNPWPITTYTVGNPILYFTGIQAGLFWFRAGDISTIFEGATTPTVIYSGNISNDDFTIIHQQEMNHH